jgi:hypothetical protein
MTVKMYGASDDLIEFEGDIYEELYPNANEWTFVGFSNGLLVKIRYDGEWIIRIVRDAGRYNLTTFDATSSASYSDILEIHDTVTWAVAGEVAL